MNVHDNISRFECELCHQRFKSKYSLKNHYVKKHEVPSQSDESLPAEKSEPIEDMMIFSPRSTSLMDEAIDQIQRDLQPMLAVEPSVQQEEQLQETEPVFVPVQEDPVQESAQEDSELETSAQEATEQEQEGEEHSVEEQTVEQEGPPQPAEQPVTVYPFYVALGQMPCWVCRTSYAQFGYIPCGECCRRIKEQN